MDNFDFESVSGFLSSLYWALENGDPGEDLIVGAILIFARKVSEGALSLSPTHTSYQDSGIEWEEVPFDFLPLPQRELMKKLIGDE